MVQVKNGAGGLQEALRQTADAIASWRAMSKADNEMAPSSGEPIEPLGIVIIGREGSESKAREILGQCPGPMPAYVLLAEQGLLYGKMSVFSRLTDMKNAAFAEQGNGGPLSLLEVDGTSRDVAGTLLMWVFFAVLFHLKAMRPDRTFDALIQKIQLDFPLRHSKLPDITRIS
jgi:hypothetical protein